MLLSTHRIARMVSAKRSNLPKAASTAAVSNAAISDRGQAIAYPGKTDFHTLVYKFCCKIPAGKVATYKTLAEAMGHPKAFRAVGSALRQNPYAPKVPCHRVVASNLTLGGFQGSTDLGGDCLRKKRRMLEEEGVIFKDGKVSPDSCIAFESSL